MLCHDDTSVTQKHPASSRARPPFGRHPFDFRTELSGGTAVRRLDWGGGGRLSECRVLVT